MCCRFRPGGAAIGTETGTAGQFFWTAGAGGGCKVSSIEEDPTTVGRVGAACEGPPNGGQRCFCNANGHMVVDLVDLTIHGGGANEWVGKDCKDVATQLAAGKCTDLLNCCFRYDYKTADGESVNTCGCGSDPSRAGYASCEEFAAVAKGTIVDTCAEWKLPGDFPIPPKP